MCGIAGIINKKSNSNDVQNLNKINIRKMIKILEHRGPDLNGFHDNKKAFFGHSRLTIIDKSNKANQPMLDKSKKFLLIFNGELYNYIELREKLKKLGYKFLTNSDTEVMLLSLCHWKEEALDKFIGMFAGCFFDLHNNNGFVFRDPFGQKPLYFKNNNDQFTFASEIKPLLIGESQIIPNYNSWKKYLSNLKYDHNDETMFKHIFQVLPGEMIYINSSGSIRKKKWYQLEANIIKKDLNYEDTSKKLQQKIFDTLNIHMRSDVDIGVCLSGGLDSSILLSSIYHTQKEREKIKCLSVEFENEFSEKKWINNVTNQHGFHSEIIQFTKKDFLTSIKPMMKIQEAPIGGLMNCAMSLIFKRCNELGIRVMQDGTGLDEAFGGYQQHHNIYVRSLKNKNKNILNKAIKEYCDNWNINKSIFLTDFEKDIDYGELALDGTIPFRHNLLNFNVLNYVKNDYSSNFSNDNLKISLINSIIENKIPRNTRMKDKLSMAYSVELRLPFLDHRIIEFGLSLPDEFMFRNGWSKSILRNSFKNILSNEVRLAPKRSIQAPQGKWLADPMFKEYVYDILNSETFKTLELFKIKDCINSYEEYLKKPSDNSAFIWQWINIFEWFETFIKNK